jgi:hypothetical protein
MPDPPAAHQGLDPRIDRQSAVVYAAVQQGRGSLWAVHERNDRGRAPAVEHALERQKMAIVAALVLLFILLLVGR